jgi:predicted NAD/FAD-binding protein
MPTNITMKSQPALNRVISQPSGSALKIAVIGTGISGLSAAWLLNKGHRVTVYEQADYVGGHSNTVQIDVAEKSMPVDTGFIVYNPLNYPNLVELFEHLNVPTKPSDMSFSVSIGNGNLEYSGTNLDGLLAQRRNLIRPRFLRMVKDLLRFYGQAQELTADDTLSGMGLGQFLRANRYSDAFLADHLMPMGAAIWSSSVEQMMQFPALSFLRFFNNHGLLQLKDRPEWRTVDGGSREYVKRLSESFAGNIHCGDRVIRVSRENGLATVATASGWSEKYDHVIFACHSDRALSLLAHPTAQEASVLGRINYQPNTAVLHTDVTLMPKRERAWASWNYLGTGNMAAEKQLCVTYWMNLLQSLPTQTPVLLTLNPIKTIAPNKILRTFEYDHPIFDTAAIEAQAELWTLQGHQNTWFCGAYFGSGFHEDGIQAGLAVAEMLGGIKRPWHIENPSGRIGLSGQIETLPALAA